MNDKCSHSLDSKFYCLFYNLPVCLHIYVTKSMCEGDNRGVSSWNALQRTVISNHGCLSPELFYWVGHWVREHDEWIQLTTLAEYRIISTQEPKPSNFWLQWYMIENLVIPILAEPLKNLSFLSAMEGERKILSWNKGMYSLYLLSLRLNLLGEQKLHYHYHHSCNK